MNPAFRKAIYDLPLCEGDIETPSVFVTGGKRKMLFQIQRLCVMLQEANLKAWSTLDLTKSFGWNNAEGQ